MLSTINLTELQFAFAFEVLISQLFRKLLLFQVKCGVASHKLLLEINCKLMSMTYVSYCSATQTKYHHVLQKYGFATTIKTPELAKASVTSFPPLSEPIPGLPTPIYSNAKEDKQVTEITTLSNGLRVASENRFGQFFTVGGKLTATWIF